MLTRRTPISASRAMDGSDGVAITLTGPEMATTNSAMVASSINPMG